jgi:hypothetical protein
MRSAEYQRGFDAGYREALRDILKLRESSEANRRRMEPIRLGGKPLPYGRQALSRD